MIGIAYALLSAALFGVSAPFAKVLLGEVSPWLLAGLLYFGSGLGLVVVRLIWRSKEAELSRNDLPWLAAAVLSGGIVGPVLLLFGLAQSSASEAALLLNLESVLTLVMAWVIFKENVDRRLMIGAIAIVAGAVIPSWPEDASLGLNWGPLLIAGACLAWAIDNNLTRKVSAADPMQIAMVKGLVAGFANVAIAMMLGASLPAAGTIGQAGLIGFFSYGISLTLFVLALRHLGAARTGAYYSLAPFIGAGAAILLLSEPVPADPYDPRSTHGRRSVLIRGAVGQCTGCPIHISKQMSRGGGATSEKCQKRPSSARVLSRARPPAKLITTLMLPRVAFEYGQVRCAFFHQHPCSLWIDASTHVKIGCEKPSLHQPCLA
jgi:drug/metabolite transporter (DMT)-like permease